MVSISNRIVSDSTRPTPGVDCSTASSVGKIRPAASSISFSSRRMVVSSGSSRARWISTRRRTKGSAISAVAPARLHFYFAAVGGGGGLGRRRAGGGGGGRGGRRRGARGGGGRRDEAGAGAEQVAQSPPLLGVGVGGREVAAAQQPGDGLGVLAVTLGLVAVHGLHGVGVAEDKGDVLLAAGIGEPVPAVHALAGEEEAVAEGSDGAEEGVGVGGQVTGEADLAVAIEDDEEQGPGVEIDAGIESGAGGRREGTHGEGLLWSGFGKLPLP